MPISKGDVWWCMNCGPVLLPCLHNILHDARTGLPAGGVHSGHTCIQVIFSPLYCMCFNFHGVQCLRISSHPQSFIHENLDISGYTQNNGQHPRIQKVKSTNMELSVKYKPHEILSAFGSSCGMAAVQYVVVSVFMAMLNALLLAEIKVIFVSISPSI